MKRRCSGQSIIEYLIIISLVGLAIIVGGPVLKRSLFGSFKIQEDSVMDSFSEEMRQLTTSASTVLGCDCSTAAAPAWNDGGCGGGPCSATEKYYWRNCKPIACDEETKCEGDASCCIPEKGVSRLHCGTLIGGNPATNPNVDVDTITGGPYRGTYNPWAAYTAPRIAYSHISQMVDTIYLGGKDTEDCLFKEMLVSLTCGVTGDMTGATQKTLACVWAENLFPLRPDNVLAVCRPGCWGKTLAGSSPCLLSETATAGRGVSNMAAEVSYRKRGGIIDPATGDLKEDIPERKKITSSSISPDVTLYSSPSPYNNPSTITYLDPLDSTIYYGTYLLPWTYLSNAAECSPARRCERVCPGGSIPSADHTYCLKPVCDNLKYQDQAYADEVGGRMTFLTPEIDVPAYYLVRVSAFDLNYIIGCFNDKGDKITGANTNDARILACPGGFCASPPCSNPITSFSVSGKHYCFDEDNRTNGGVTRTAGLCPDTSQIVVRIKDATNPGPLPHVLMDYGIYYQEQRKNTEVEVLADNRVKIYQSYKDGAKGNLLYQTPPIDNNYSFPTGNFKAAADYDGKTYLLVEHTNTDNNDIGGVSLKQRTLPVPPYTSCFDEADTQIYTLATGTPNGSVHPGNPGWNNNGCWLWQQAPATPTLDTRNLPQALHVASALQGNALSCGCAPCPANKPYCVAGECVCVPNCVATSHVCGEDGCGGSCGDCPPGDFCMGATGTCCTPNCAVLGKTCGDDGCGHPDGCGICPVGTTCDATFNCVGCTPDCTGKVCGDDGCSNPVGCGTCPAGQTCNATQTACAITARLYADDHTKLYAWDGVAPGLGAILINHPGAPACISAGQLGPCGPDQLLDVQPDGFAYAKVSVRNSAGKGGFSLNDTAVAPGFPAGCFMLMGVNPAIAIQNGTESVGAWQPTKCWAIGPPGSQLDNATFPLNLFFFTYPVRSQPLCVRNCAGRMCGDDGCGGTCGSCPAAYPVCSAGACCNLGGSCVM